MKNQKIFRTYSELSKLKTFDERFEYLKLNGQVCEETFGLDRYLNQAFYRSREWKEARRKVLIRDQGFDMGVEGFPVGDRAIIHHMNPIDLNDVNERNPDIFNPEFLVCVSYETHNAIHYSDDNSRATVVERKPGDTCPWKGGN